MINKKTILIIEDEKPMSQLLKDTLVDEGFNVVLAYNGVTGLSKAKKIKPDLILLDIIMPKMDGITLLKKIRKDKWGSKAKIIILSNLSNDTVIEEALDNGVYSFLIKSNWKLKDLLVKIKKNLKRK